MRTLLFIACIMFARHHFALAQDACVSIRANTLAAPKGAKGIWGQNQRFWPQGATLRVRFIDGSTKQRSEAWKRFQVVDNLVNLSFLRVPSGESEIRVQFAFGVGHWSYVGKGCLSIPQNAPTMNLGLSTMMIGGDGGAEWDRVAIHEVLHAIGFEHEHQSPLSKIPWNREAVFEYYAQTQGWSRQQTEYQVMRKSEAKDIQASDYDPESIMQYPVLAAHTLNGFSVPWNKKLSAKDIAMLATVYPQ